MIGAMRTTKGGIGMYIILGLLFVGLIGFGIGGFGGFNARSIGTVGNTTIPLTTYVNTLTATQRDIINRTGQAPSYQNLLTSGTLDAILDNSIRATALEDLNADLGISIGDDTLRDDIIANPQFRGLDGQFSQTSFDFFLENNNLTSAEFDRLSRRNSARLILERAIFAGIEAPEAAAAPIVNYALQTREVAWIPLTEDDLETPIGEISDADARAYFDDNQDQFQSLATKEISYAWLTPDMVDEVEVSEDELQEAYEAAINRYSLPERRAMERLVFLDTASAEAAKARVDAGEIDFAALVEERGLTLGDIDLGIIERGEVDPDAAAALFGDIEIGLYGPFQSDLGPALYNVNAILNAQTIPFEEAREELLLDLEITKRDEVLAAAFTDAENLVAEVDTIEEIAERSALEIGSISFTAESTDGIAAYQEFREAAELSAAGDFPEIYGLSDGGVFVMQVVDDIPAGDQAFEDVIEEARTAARAEAVQTALSDLASELQARAEAGESFSSLGYRSSQVSGLARGVPTDDFGPIAIAAIFGADENGYVVTPSDDGISLIEIQEVTTPDLEDDANANVIANINAELSREFSSDLLNQFADGIADEAGVGVDFAIIDQLHNQLFPGQLAN
ncbi:MAG: peptidylprolyl isomerase [Pseudomonadota bacterium]